MRVLARMRISLPAVQEVRYVDVVLDAGPYTADAREPADPMLIIDVGRSATSPHWKASPIFRFNRMRT